IWVCVFARPTLEKSRATWGSRAGAFEHHELPTLDDDEAAELARTLLLPVEHVSLAVLGHLVERTQGIPRLLVELIGGLKREGFVRRSERGGGFFLATDELTRLPDLPIVQWSASREVESLAPELAS